jgi:RNA polymerase sigma-70 factor, ECF subfamily
MSAELVERAQRGDREAFGALATAAYHRLYRIARRILRDGYAAEDAVQDALVHAWRDVRGLRDRDKFDAWLNRLLVNACRDQQRRSQRRVIEVEVGELDRDREDGEIGRLIDRDELEEAFLRLSIEHRAVLVLTHHVGMSAAEIADVLRIPTGTVYSRLHYGEAAMRDALAPPSVAGQAPIPEHSP